MLKKAPSRIRLKAQLAQTIIWGDYMENQLNSNFLFNLMFNDYKLTPTEFALYYLIRQIYFFWGETEGCYGTDEFFASKLNVSEGTIKRTLILLKEAGLITTKQVKLRGCVVRRYIFPLEDRVLTKNAELIRAEREKLIEKLSHGDHNGVQNDPRHEDQNDPQDNKYLNNNKNIFKDITESQDDPRQAFENCVLSGGILFDKNLTPLTSLDSEPLSPNQPAPRPPSPLEGDFRPIPSEKVPRNQKNINNPRQDIGGEEKIDLSEGKHEEIELTTNPSSDTIKAQWNNIAREFNLAQITVLTAGRLQKVKAAIKACGGIDRWCEGIRSQLTQSAFHRGVNDRGWKANFDYYSRADKALAALESAGTAPVVEKKQTSFDKAVEILFGK